MRRKKRKVWIVPIVLFFGAAVFTATGLAAGENPAAPGRAMARQAIKSDEHWKTADHSKHKALQVNFESGPRITDACLSCHTEAESQFHKTIHWTWLAAEQKDGKLIGKAGDSVNNFCISTNYTNDKSCSSCHPGWDGKSDGINCLVCHGRTSFNFKEAFDDYAVFSASDDPEEKQIAEDIQKDIQKAAQNVDLPGRTNCGSCHFYGGGGDGVKHGDLDSSMAKPDKILDVHMGTDGRDFKCTRCHTTFNHHIAGRIYTLPAAETRKSLVEDDQAAKIACESCHTATPHKYEEKPNDHTDKVACQTCHIPTFARVNPTKMKWDWSKAGQLKDGKPFSIKDCYGKESYLSIKGEMKWDKNVTPEYHWFNGSMATLTVKDIIDPSGIVAVSQPLGNKDDSDSRIFPFKIHQGNQPYDKVHKTLLAPLLSGPDGYWTTFDWDRALSKGMASMNLPFSKEFDFVETTYAYPTTHMVAPKDQAVKCIECHTSNQSRMAGLDGFYMPGRDSFKLLDLGGWAMVIGSLIGVSLHALGRIFFSFRRKNASKEEETP
ncbi:MAG: tetrathionate reductase family octaheme c-type cytochrome [Proteobacteria bacterium]|nr:tetrathionate reductase family octaheme c-type cytochrome [Pseudomonadota bacterium]MBU4469668.1 tetrathionate reductase family octaheme c-type cytochrome [Pseudomonadota bacterium]MCG2751751.1 tetrathionate reductase family octaheme c-type cytochrome [Desulfobacteraceae bacterium]